MLLFYRYQMTYLSCMIMVSSICAANRSFVPDSSDMKRVTRETGKENRRSTEKPSVAPQEEDEDKKTLAQQVADGKYGLIQKELFSKPVKRPGVLSYEINPEVPRDNVNNFGGLKAEEIWLAENHLLVLKGGGFRNGRKKTNWPPIDDYVAPKRRVKIPQNPKVPPPFPIQLEDGGPIELVKSKNNGSRVGNTTKGDGGGFHFPPLFPPLDPAELDEDDPRIYYPPPYDFVLERDNHTTYVPPGPLVPGIVLPPPPNFFAPLNPPKPTQPPAKENKPSVTEKKPKVQPVITNEVKPKSKPKVEVIEGGWVPIAGPAPTPPAYGPYPPATTQPDHASKNTSKSRPSYNGRNRYYKVLDAALHQNYDFSDVKKENYYTTTSVPYDGFEPVIFNLRTDVRTTVSPAYAYPISFTGDKKIKETFYFYRDPYDVRGKAADTAAENVQTTKKPQPQVTQKGRKVNFETNTLAPPKLYDGVSITASTAEKPSPVQINYFDQSYVKNPREQDYQYVYYNRNPEYTTDPGYSYQLPQDPYGEQPIEYYNNQGNRGYKLSSTSKTPIYEYSFSAPGYGSSEPPKIATTPKPIEIEISTHKRPQYSYFEYQTTPKEKNIFSYNPSTARPQMYTTRKPNYDRGHTYTNIHALFQTSNPFDTFITRNVGTMDDITKKYFTLFGQKLNQQNVNEPITTPSPPPARVKPNKPYYEDQFRSMIHDGTKPSRGQNTRYQTQTYDVATEDPYYLKNEEYQLQNYKVRLVKPQPNLQQNVKYGNFYPTAIPQYDQYDYNRAIVRPNHPISSDIEVNYRQRPAINPEAEFIDPRLINRENLSGNSYISYQLPGSGGHFYFITPRSVENYQLANSGFRYPNGENSEYRRNTPNQPQRHRRKRPENN